jgi:hypothetical protein
MPGDYHTLNTLADKMGFQWAGIEGAMKFANQNPAFRHLCVRSMGDAANLAKGRYRLDELTLRSGRSSYRPQGQTHFGCGARSYNDP